jgi:hypothetical protein
MLESLKDTKKLGATVAAAGALAMGVGASKAEAAPAVPKQAAAAEIAPSHAVSLEELTAQSVERLLSNQPINYYRGHLEILDA